MTKECVIKDLFGILVIVIVNVTNHVTCKNCKCRKKIVGELVEECSKSIDENKIVYNKTFNVSVGDYKYSFCTLYILLFVVILIVSVIIGGVFICCHCYLKKNPKVLLLV